MENDARVSEINATSRWMDKYAKTNKERRSLRFNAATKLAKEIKALAYDLVLENSFPKMSEIEHRYLTLAFDEISKGNIVLLPTHMAPELVAEFAVTDGETDDEGEDKFYEENFSKGGQVKFLLIMSAEGDIWMVNEIPFPLIILHTSNLLSLNKKSEDQNFRKQMATFQVVEAITKASRYYHESDDEIRKTFLTQEKLGSVLVDILT